MFTLFLTPSVLTCSACLVCACACIHTYMYIYIYMKAHVLHVNIRGCIKYMCIGTRTLRCNCVGHPYRKQPMRTRNASLSCPVTWLRKFSYRFLTCSFFFIFSNIFIFFRTCSYFCIFALHLFYYFHNCCHTCSIPFQICSYFFINVHTFSNIFQLSRKRWDKVWKGIGKVCTSRERYWTSMKK